MPVEQAKATWVRAAVLAGVFYGLVGIAFAVPSSHARAWRLAAWAVSGIAYAAHITYERITLGNSPRSAATHVALAAALGAFLLAVGANVHSLLAEPAGHQQLMLLLALVLFPAITVLPAFLVALALGSMLPNRRRDIANLEEAKHI